MGKTLERLSRDSKTRCPRLALLTGITISPRNSTFPPLSFPQMPSIKHQYFHPRHGITLVKLGFSWPAFFFGSLWALARRVYPVFFAMLAIDGVLWFVTGYAAAQRAVGLTLLGLLGTLTYAVVRGRYGNRWVRSSLESRAYVLRSGSSDV